MIVSQSHNGRTVFIKLPRSEIVTNHTYKKLEKLLQINISNEYELRESVKIINAYLNTLEGCKYNNSISPIINVCLSGKM